ncbi:sugar transferase [Alloyangia pacifica]|uniref:sugar transferase n=1 Tax=Alloyangia pacifica TaxID=311180 RepID=UPI001CFC6A26|nr:sugar transferase [Alloyangia pacifica]
MFDAGYYSDDSGIFSSQRRAYREKAQGPYRSVVKPVCDLLLALAMLPLLAPVIALLWALVRMDGGPGFFGHRRIGKNGKVFRCWKIRTMVPNAEAKLQQHLAANPAARAEWARDHKLTDDPRITRLGRFLRETSLDELPQIWNVLTGEMSFVGPRPVVRAEITKYGIHRTAYLLMKPGITGLWQVSGRNDVTYAERVEMDVRYLNDQSLATDSRLLLLTAKSVLGRTGR